MRALVELEIPDTVDLDALRQKLAEAFPGMRFPADEDLVVFFRPFVEDGEVQWGTVAPAEVVQYCKKTVGQQLHPVDRDEVYYHVMGEVFGVSEALILRKDQG